MSPFAVTGHRARTYMHNGHSVATSSHLGSGMPMSVHYMSACLPRPYLTMVKLHPSGAKMVEVGLPPWDMLSPSSASLGALEALAAFATPAWSWAMPPSYRMCFDKFRSPHMMRTGYRASP